MKKRKTQTKRAPKQKPPLKPGTYFIGGIAVPLRIPAEPRTWGTFKRELMRGPIDCTAEELKAHRAALAKWGRPFVMPWHIIMPFAHRDIMRVALAPKNWKPPEPESRKRYRAARAAANAAARAVAPGRIVRVINSVYVEVWKPEEWNRARHEFFTPAEVAADAYAEKHDLIFHAVARPAQSRTKGTEGTKARGARNRVRVRAAYEELRKWCPGPGNKDYIQRRLAGEIKVPSTSRQPYKQGLRPRLSLRTIKKHTADLK